MQKNSQLILKAINAAKDLDWPTAISVNLEIINVNSLDIKALNRVGLAYLQLEDVKNAKKYFQKVLQIDKSNIIAKKNLDKIKNNQIINIKEFSNNSFIDEPGKAKTVSLTRLASKATIQSLCIGQTCQLVSKNRFISVETENNLYIGSLPEDLSFRLSKLISTGNIYSCHIQSFSEKNCCVHIKEKHVSPKNQDIHSFPVNGPYCKPATE